MLADVRASGDIEVALDAGRAWVRWAPGNDDVVLRLLPLAGVAVYAYRGDHWFRPGQRLPVFNLPAGLEYRPLHQVLTPARVDPVPAATPEGSPVLLRLVPDHRPRAATALTCGLAELAAWADTVPAPRLSALKAARQQDRVLVLGPRLPPLMGGTRLWGDAVLTPLGYRPEPGLPESALREALAAGQNEIVVLSPEGAEIISRDACRPLNRASIRRAWQGIESAAN